MSPKRRTPGTIDWRWVRIAAGHQHSGSMQRVKGKSEGFFAISSSALSDLERSDGELTTHWLKASWQMRGNTFNFTQRLKLLASKTIEIRSRVMSAIRSHGNLKTEIQLAKIIRKSAIALAIRLLVAGANRYDMNWVDDIQEAGRLLNHKIASTNHDEIRMRD
jgi:hypothetical protein